MRSQTGSLAVDLPALSGLPWHQRQLVARLAELRRGSLRVTLGGAEFEIKGVEPGPDAQLVFHRPGRVLRRFWRGDLGFAEAFMAGDWDSPDLAQLMEFLAVNLDAYRDSDARHRLVQAFVSLRHRWNRNSRTGSRRNIAAHYDLGNDFYAQWLDSGMTYSSALFEGSESLCQAQEHKYQRMLELTGARPGQHILEIGCGWGGFAEYAARRGIRVTGLTLSAQQLEYAQQRIQAAGLSDLVGLHLRDYRDFAEPVDHIVSIEMFEAVGREYWQDYFEQLVRLLKPGGCAALQIITIDEELFEQYAATPGGFIQTYIFPGGMLPTCKHLRALAAEAGLKICEMRGFGLDYATTLARWYDTFVGCTDWMERHGYDERFRRMWRYYLAFCEGGFRARQIDVMHCAMVRA